MAAEESKINSAITFSSIDEGTPMPEFACAVLFCYDRRFSARTKASSGRYGRLSSRSIAASSKSLLFGRYSEASYFWSAASR